MESHFLLVAGIPLGLLTNLAIREIPAWLENQWGEPVIPPAPTGSARQYLFVLALVIAITACCATRFGNDTYKAAAAAAFSAGMVALAMIDHRSGLLPDVLTLPLIWAGLLTNTAALFVSPQLAIWGAAAGYVFPWAFAQGYLALTGREGLGQGDAKLLAAVGAWLGVNALLPILFLAAVMGVAIFLARILILRAAWRTPAPFGPFLVLAAIVLLLLPQFISDPLVMLGRL